MSEVLSFQPSMQEISDPMIFPPPTSDSLLQLPSAAQATQAVREARALFLRTLTGWASDALLLRHSGRDLPKWGAESSTATGLLQAA